MPCAVISNKNIIIYTISSPPILPPHVEVIGIAKVASWQKYYLGKKKLYFWPSQALLFFLAGAVDLGMGLLPRP